MDQSNHNKKQTLLFSILAVGLIASITVSAVTMHEVFALKKALAVDDSGQNLSGETTENDVKIADFYTIHATTNISDAYISGDDTKLSDTEKETLSMAKSVLDEIVTADMSPFEQEKAVYDWMTTNIETDEGTMTVIPTADQGADTPYGVLKNHKAVCVGYATTFRLLMEMLQIPCKVVHNAEAYHSWDLVQLDGEWYHTDVYSDSGMDNYANFNMSDEQMAENQNWDTSYFPAAVGYQYNMAYQNRVELTDVYKIPKKVREALGDSKSVMGIEIKDISDEDQAIADKMVETLAIAMMNSEEYADYGMNHSWLTVEGQKILTLSIVDYSMNNSDENMVSEDDKEKILQSIDKAFEGTDIDAAGAISDADEADDDAIWDDRTVTVTTNGTERAEEGE